MTKKKKNGKNTRRLSRMSAVAEKFGGNIVIDFKEFADKKKIINALNKKPVKFSEMSEKDRYETMRAMRDED